MKGSDNVWPKLIVSEGTVPASPSAGQQKLYIDSADHKLKRVNSAGGITTVEGGGVGTSSGYPPGSADLPPTVANAKDDEFDGTSTVAWTSTPTVPTSWDINTTRPSHAALRSNGNGNNVAGKYQAVPAAYPFTVTAKLSGTNVHGAANSVGIFVAPAAPVGSSNLFVPMVQIAATETVYQRVTITFAGAFVGGTRAVSIPINSGSGGVFRDDGVVYFRMKVNSATSIDCSLSRDGWNWVTFEAAVNPGFTPGVMGLMVSESGTADLTAHFDWFRVT